MGKDKISLDELFKKKLGDLDSASSSKNWEEMEKMLDNQDKRKRKGYFFFASLGILGLLILTAVFYCALKDDKKTVLPSVENSNEVKRNETGGKETGKNPDERSSVNSHAPEAEASIEQKDNVKADVDLESSKDHLKTSVNQKKSLKVSKNNDLVIQVRDQNIAFHSKKKTKEAKKENENAVPEKDDPNNNSQFAKEQIVNNAEHSLTGLNFIPAKQFLQDSENTGLLISGDLFRPNDSLLVKTKSKVGVFLNAGLAYGFHTNSFHPEFGVNINYQFHPKIAVDLSVLYSSEGKFLLTDSGVQRAYFLNKESHEEFIELHKFKYIHVPLQVQYNFFKGHWIQAGAGISYVLDSKGDYREIQVAGQNELIRNEANVTGYMDGVNQLNYFLSAGYLLDLNQRFRLSAGFRYGLNSLIKKDIFREENELFNNSIRLSVQYKIF